MSTITKKVSVYQENKKLKDILATKMKSLKITEKTKSLWFPKAENAKQFDKLYTNES